MFIYEVLGIEKEKVEKRIDYLNNSIDLTQSYFMEHGGEKHGKELVANIREDEKKLLVWKSLLNEL